MSSSQHPAERSLRAKLMTIRATALFSMVYCMLYLMTTFLLVTGALSQTDEEVRAAAFQIVLVSSVSFAVMFLLAFFGFRAARDRFRVLPFAVVSVIASVYLVGGTALGGAAAVESMLATPTGIISLLYSILLVISACVAIGLVAYNKRHPKGEEEIPAPEHVPDSLRAAQKGVSPIDAAEPALELVGVPEAASAAATVAGSGTASAAAADDSAPLQLRISSKIGSVIHDKMDVLDAHDNVIYRVSSAAISLHDRTRIEDVSGNKVADIHAKLISIHNRYYIDMADGVSFEMASEILHLKDVVNIDELGWQLRGDHMIEFNFDVTDQATGALVAHASRQLISLHDTYTVDVFDRSRADELVAIFVVMKHIVEHRQHAAAASSSSTSASN